MLFWPVNILLKVLLFLLGSMFVVALLHAFGIDFQKAFGYRRAVIAVAVQMGWGMILYLILAKLWVLK